MGAASKINLRGEGGKSTGTLMSSVTGTVLSFGR